MKKLLLALPLALAATIAIASSPAVADDDKRTNARERAADHQDLRQDRRQAADDLRDAARLQVLVDRHHAATTAPALIALHQEVDRLLAAETGEAVRETAQANREVRQDRREVRSDRKEIRENRVEGATAGERRDDQRDRRDDRRDLRDDRLDAAGEAARREQFTALHARWGTLDPAGDVQARLAVLAELQRLARGELTADQAERGEDRRELREDRRETREDRRQN